MFDHRADGRPPRVVLITGTGTDVGKTVVTAALAARARTAGRSVAVLKPVQTGVPGAAPGDVATVCRLAGDLPVAEGVRLAMPLAPEPAAAAQRRALPPIERHAERVRALAVDHDLVLVEGAGGLLVRLDAAGGTIAGLARLLPNAAMLLVVTAGLGTLNHAELTVEALRARGVPLLGLVIGSWPAMPGAAELSNLTELPRLTGVPLLGAVPAGAGQLPTDQFIAATASWLAPALGGTFAGPPGPVPP